VITWSHTKISDYLQCPYKFFEKYIKKSTKTVESEAMRKGNRIHKLLENAINQDDGIARNMSELETSRLMEIIPILNRMKDLGAAAELELGVKKDWTPCGFWDKEVWGRCKIDVLAADGDRGIIVDWKTGATKNLKYQTENELKLHAVIAHAHFPELKIISGRYFYTQDFIFYPTPPSKPYIFTGMIAERHRINALMGRIEYAVENEKCGTRKNNLCPWCEVKTCKHYKPKDK
jgi:CRISPR/Cas system-associated exonuclease Cas4 (RecB family)